jgi:pimeloyl-ACP methyl ester carboxylesterase
MTRRKDVIVLLPGIMGSALARNGKPVWDLSAGAVGSFLTSLGSSVQDLVPLGDGSPSDVTATHLLKDTHLIPYLWKIDGYSGLANYIRARFDLTPGENFFEFPYDWRLDNRISAQKLKVAVSDWLDNQRLRYPDARLTLVAHSMGGLVARYFLEALDGWRVTRTLVTLGTPHRGSVKALDFLVNGLTKTLGPIKLIDLTKLVRSLPSVYQLLPIYECVGATEEGLQRLEEVTEVGDLDMERARAGVAFHREIQRKVQENLKKAEYRDAGYKLVPIVGTYQPTYLSAVLTKDGVTPIRKYKGQTLLHGDGTVPGVSATPIELSNAGREMFAACPHGGLQNFDPVRVQIRATLEDMDTSEFKAVAAEAISLDVKDAYHSSEGISGWAQYPGATDLLDVVISNEVTGEEWPCEVTADAGHSGRQSFRHAPLDAGSYRIRVNVGENVTPISDVFAIVD